MRSISPDQEDLDFHHLPPFPTSSSVPTAPLLRISLAHLLDPATSHAASQDLFRACTDLGFFYLDLRGGNRRASYSSSSSSSSPSREHHGDDDDDAAAPIEGDALLENAEALFHLASTVFDLEEEEKARYDMMGENSYFGYKGFGKGVIDGKGTRDRNEFWNISKDDILGLSEPLRNPDVLTTEATRRLMKQYMLRSHALVTLILTHLNTHLGLPPHTLPNLHRLGARSGDQMRWVKSPPQEPSDRQTALGEHTDFGSVTILFNRLGGLQVLPPATNGMKEEWAYVKPLKGHCVVNLGDALVKFTAGVLRSNLHRVVNPPGQQQHSTRYSLVYFNRPEDDVTLKVLDGSALIDAKRKADPSVDAEEAVTAKQWILNRAMGRRTGGDWSKGQGTDQERIEKRDSAVAAAA